MLMIMSDTLTCAPLMSSLLTAFLSGDGDAMIVDSGLANCDAAGDLLEFTSKLRRDDTEFAVCRLTVQSTTTRNINSLRVSE